MSVWCHSTKSLRSSPLRGGKSREAGSRSREDSDSLVARSTRSTSVLFVTFDIASQISGNELDFDLSFCAYILVQEPQPDFTRPPRRVPSITDRLKLEKWSSIRNRDLIRAISEEKAVGLVSPTDRRRVVDHDCS